jgi:hypothetical protein
VAFIGSSKSVFRQKAREKLDDNRAERGLRPLVIARKTSFGSQSEAGARTRETSMTALHTLRKRTTDVTAAFAQALDRLAQGSADAYVALGFDSS